MKLVTIFWFTCSFHSICPIITFQKGFLCHRSTTSEFTPSWYPKLVFSTNILFQAPNTPLQICVPSLSSFPSPLTVYSMHIRLSWIGTCYCRHTNSHILTYLLLCFSCTIIKLRKYQGATCLVYFISSTCTFHLVRLNNILIYISTLDWYRQVGH